jgi:hypothetical protein
MPMSRSSESQLNLPCVPVHSLAPERTTSGSPDGQGVVPSGSDGLSLLRDAVASTCSDKEAYLALGLPDASYWSKVKRGEKPEPRIGRLTDLPPATQREYVKRWGRQLGMHVSDASVQQRAVGELLSAAVNVMRELAG